MINIDTKLLEALKQSTCFGLAHDETVPECKQCDVRAQCKVKSEGEMNIPIPKGKAVVSQPVKEVAKKETPKKQPVKKTDKPSTPAKKSSPAPKKAAPSNTDSLPDFKNMSLDELRGLANLRKVEWKDYGNDQITRMRLIMSIKKSY